MRRCERQDKKADATCVFIVPARSRLSWRWLMPFRLRTIRAVQPHSSSSSLPQPRRTSAPVGPRTVSTHDTSPVRPGALTAFEWYPGLPHRPASKDQAMARRRRTSLAVIWAMPELVRQPAEEGQGG